MARRTRVKGRAPTRRPQRTRAAAKRPQRTRAPTRRPQRTRKRKLNGFFKLMLKAKENGDESFVYKGNTYKGTKHPKLKMIYKRA